MKVIGICIIAAAQAAVSQASGATTENPKKTAAWSKIILNLEEFEKLMLPAVKELINMAKKDNAEAGAHIDKYWGYESWLWTKLKGMKDDLNDAIPKLKESVVKGIKETMESKYKQGLALLKEAEEIHKNI